MYTLDLTYDEKTKKYCVTIKRNDIIIGYKFFDTETLARQWMDKNIYGYARV